VNETLAPLVWYRTRVQASKSSSTHIPDLNGTGRDRRTRFLTDGPACPGAGRPRDRRRGAGGRPPPRRGPRLAVRACGAVALACTEIPLLPLPASGCRYRTRPGCWSRAGLAPRPDRCLTPPIGIAIWSAASSARSRVRTPAGLPSTFPPPDARPRGTGRNGQGRPVTARAAARPFAHVTSDDRNPLGTGGDHCGDGGAVCKTAGFAYTGSNPVPATPPLTCGNGRCTALVTPPGRARLPSTFPPVGASKSVVTAELRVRHRPCGAAMIGT
jgi:hypothetical protein